MIYCIDLDGTLSETTGTDYANAKPNDERIERVNALHDDGDTIIIDTARGSGSGEDWTERTASQLAEWGVKYGTLRCGVKIPADMYVDDRGVNVLDWVRD